MSQYFYGKNVVRQLLEDHAEIKTVWFAVNDAQLESMCNKNRVQIKRTDKKNMTRLTGTDRHQGVCAEMPDYKTYTLEELMRSVPEGKPGLFILLDQLEDPHNLGAILRTADAVGADGVIFKKTHAVGLTPTVAKVSAGAIDTVKCCAVTNLNRALETLQKNGWWTVGTDMDGQDYRSLDYDFNTVLIIGNEGDGISRMIREKCDYVISLPMFGRIESLNASVSAGVLMYEIFSRRNPM